MIGDDYSSARELKGLVSLANVVDSAMSVCIPHACQYLIIAYRIQVWERLARRGGRAGVDRDLRK